MWIGVITIFPELFEPFLSTSLVGRAVEEGRLEIEVRDLREWAQDPHRVVDDEPYGGGGGMVMKAGPLVRATRELSVDRDPHHILLSPQGRRLDDARVQELSGREELLLLCGRYEGVDERVKELVVDEEISIGDYVLSGGELAAMVVIETVSRYVPGVVGLPEAVERDSFHSGLLDHPHYTRPAEFEGLRVPDVLRSGDHAAIERWREIASLRATAAKRPDLLPGTPLTPAQRRELGRLRARESGASDPGAACSEDEFDE